MDNGSIDGLNYNVSSQRKNTLRSLKSKKEKVSLPRPSSASGNEHLDEKQHRKNRQAASGTLRPARVNIPFRKFEKTFLFSLIKQYFQRGYLISKNLSDLVISQSSNGW